ncbi:hypothetical protein D3C85_1877610 [compost metagenome]
MLCVPFKHATPAQIVNEVFGCHPMKVHHPDLQSTLISVDVLDMKIRQKQVDKQAFLINRYFGGAQNQQYHLAGSRLN